VSAPARQPSPPQALAPVRALHGDSAASDTPASPPADRLLTPDALAERWQVNKAHVYRLTREGRLPTVKIGRYYRYRLAAVETWEQSGGDQGASE
jgi:excisionase family DNA binding protein